MCYNGNMNQIKQFLTDNRLSQRQLAEALGYSANYINLVANGKRQPTRAFRWAWAEAFGRDTLHVLNETEPSHDAA